MKKNKIIFWLGIFFLCVACSRSSNPSELIARQFMDLYYVKADLAAALGSTDGYAHQKLQEGIQLTEGQAIAETTHHPKIQVSLLESHQEQGEADYLFHVVIEPTKASSIQKKVMLKVREREGAWRVTQFSDYDLEGGGS
ncbi:MAG: hypothetical protein HY073_04135 [Deltaproteobacteria bacterium]|nr:hypothetical protein [Deltaproteobacteria bacterium]